jgi:uncharacterized protein DUF2652
MTIPASPTSRRSGTLLLADISGYTGFLQGVADAHQALILDTDDPPYAYALMSSTLGGIVEALAPTFVLSKLEGDAVFAVANDDALDADGMLRLLRDCYAAFRGRLAEAGETWTCTCNACTTIDSLDLKFVIHHGGFVEQSIAGHTELLGPNVNLVHRLLKNHAVQLVGRVPYALFTDDATRALSLATDAMTDGEEAYDGIAPFPVHIMVLSAA